MVRGFPFNQERPEILLRDAYNAQRRADRRLQYVFDYLEQHNIDGGTVRNYCNAGSLEEGISCYVAYGEESAERLAEDAAEIYRGGDHDA